MKILVSGNWAPNKGDRAVLTFIIEQLLINSSIEKIYVSTTNPAYYKGKLDFGNKVKFVPFGCNMYITSNNSFINKIIAKIKRLNYFKHKLPIIKNNIINNKESTINNLGDRKFINALNDSDLVIVTGGHHITSMREYDSINSITYDLGIIKLSGKKYVLWAQTIGPLDFVEESNKLYIYNLLYEADTIFLRDNNSHDTINKLGFKLNNIMDTYDSVFGLYKSNYKKYVTEKNSGVIGISIFYSNFKNSEELEKYINQMSKICEYLLSKNYRIKFFPMETDYTEINIIENIIKNLDSQNISIFDTNVPSNEHILEVNKCELFIGHKTHSVVFSLITNTPLVALCYHKKTKDFMKMYNLEDYAILDEEFNMECFEKTFTKLESNKYDISKQMDLHNKRFSMKVINDFNSLVAQMEGEKNN